jgi:hypothetical protein
MSCNSPKKWEYLILPLVRVCNKQTDYYDRYEFLANETYRTKESALNSMGQEGWELVAVVDSDYIFKRELES